MTYTPLIPAKNLRVQQSGSTIVEEDAIIKFSISLTDVERGGIAADDIDISSISVSMKKSTGGGAFSASGITQPVFSKAAGLVSVDYRFLAAEWAIGDVYELVVSGINVDIEGDTAYVKTCVWSNVVLEEASLEGKVDAIQSDIGDPSSRTNLQSLTDMLGNPDAAGKSVYGNIGDFVGQTNLQSLLAALAIPDTAGKGLFVELATDRLDNATYGLNALKTTISGVQTDLDNGTDGLGALKALIDTVDGVVDGIQTDLDNGTDGLGALKSLIDTVDGVVDNIQADVGDPSARTNLQSLTAMLGNPDAAGASLYDNLGNFVGQTNLQSLLAVLGVPDVAGKPLYTCLVTDRLDNGTYGLSALKTLIDTIDTVSDSIQTDLGNPSARTNLQTIEAMLGNPDAAGASVYDNLGNFVGQTNLQSLLAVLGVPDVAGKPLYTCLVTDRLDNGTYGLSALKTLIDTVDTVVDGIQTDLDNGTDGLGALKTLIDAVDAVVDTNQDYLDGTTATPTAYRREVGVEQIAATTEDLNQAAGNYDLFTGTGQDCIVETLNFRLPNVDVSDDATITSISIQTDDATPYTFIDSTAGAKANLTAEKQLEWTGSALIKVGTKIQLTINGGAADAATVCDCVVKNKAVADGGYLA